MKYFLIPAVFFAVPTLLFAQVSDLFDVKDLILAILKRLGYLFWLAAIMVFFWGLVKFINNASDSKEHEAGKSLIIWGLISLLVLFSIWGLVKFFSDSFGVVNPDVCYIDSNGIRIDGAGAPC